ncbi:response regulator [Leadbettera azotonutricia]|uniref:Two-component response regulator n=1 Tax=Leadbettera azotonutricia (strain ATCC BAA-888 / DSM 13862 / ZAS-9) TaxID=545695 RepID=F5Y7Y3_LEAAZ|nr:response regulator [Leadbettera azotonutricia]AEF81914.1 two-component response regulator [Leadbettera azotonutricia ZAS-9]
MYTIMIVEDEYIERQALVLMVRNNFPELSEIGDVGNGFEALTLAKKEKPDLALIDVGIPGINGLDLIAEIQSIEPKTSFIIISSHDNFEFAQRAIKLGVEDYLLKPIKLDALKRAIGASITKKESHNENNTNTTNLINRLENIRPQVENDFIYTIISNGQVKSLGQMLSFLGFEGYCGFCLIISEQSESHHIHNLIKAILNEVGSKSINGFFNNNSVICLFFSNPQENTGLDDICNYIIMRLQKNGYADFHIGVSELVETSALWPESYRQAMAALRDAENKKNKLKKYSPGDQLSLRKTGESTAKNASQLSLWVNLLSRAILDNNDDKQKKLAEQITLVLISQYDLRQAHDEIYKLIILLREDLARVVPIPGLSLDTEALQFESEEPRSLETYLLSSIMQLSLTVSEIRDQGKNILVDQAILYIQANYQKEISLGSIAKEINISPYYLSKLFRKHTGKSCTELITDERVEAAKKLLLQNRSSKEACYQVGFNSQNYFAKIFKKLTGMTPGEYRTANLTS